MSRLIDECDRATHCTVDKAQDALELDAIFPSVSAATLLPARHGKRSSTLQVPSAIGIPAPCLHNSLPTLSPSLATVFHDDESYVFSQPSTRGRRNSTP